MEEMDTSKLCLRASEIVKNAIETLDWPSAVSHGSEAANDPDELQNIEWISSENFTIERGKQQLDEYMHTWEMHPSWLYHLIFMHETDVEFHHHLYHYRAQWSMPTASSPVPRASACVYFVIVVSNKVKSQTLPVDVYFFVESNRLTHRPGNTRFREKWLKDVIDSKTLLLNAVDF
ncbi:hypothetical protein DPEC_G00082020 [Dallia pectoralis]|uniref:Uncharacterized protein n=1 Tax=Dallia pectoralis TaxID=75939 RepID=A0ACC2GYL4_DALPE|nr:hypothetical protein DPEC_G00082020 [Dallia pectoralis]